MSEKTADLLAQMIAAEDKVYELQFRISELYNILRDKDLFVLKIRGTGRVDYVSEFVTCFTIEQVVNYEITWLQNQITGIKQLHSELSKQRTAELLENIGK